MTGFLDNAVIEIPCPKCGKKSKQRLGRLNNNSSIRCTFCGTVIELKTDGPSGLAQAKKSAEKSLADLKRSLGKLGR